MTVVLAAVVLAALLSVRRVQRRVPSESLIAFIGVAVILTGLLFTGRL